MTTQIHYRADIDGLRAIAVLVVILFHLDPTWLPGGYVGVDIFFVISGYLISRIIQRELDEGKFSFTGFYARRVRRIIPALTFVILSTVLVFQFVFSPSDLEKLVESAIYAQFFLSNLYFAFVADASYFSDDAHSQALLHLWSLAVEEQFYLFWPVILLLGFGALRLRQFIVALSVLCIVSFLLGNVLYRYDPMTAYYMLPARIGEFGLGTLVALLQARGGLAFALARPGMATMAMVVGLIMITLSCVILRPYSVFPGVNALLPTVGAALIILGGIVQPWPARVLGHPLPVFIGRISYSAYLWHWPIVVGIRYVEGDLDLVQKGIAFVATILLASVTYYVIEVPFRYKKLALGRALFRYALAPGVFLLIVDVGLRSTDGHGLFALSPSFKERYERQVRGLNPNATADYVCQRSALSQRDIQNPNCVTGAASHEKPAILLFGDSKAAQLAGLLGKVGEHTGDSIRNVAHTACPPIIDDPARFSRGKYATSCDRSAKVVWPMVLDYPKVVLSANWASYLERDDMIFEQALIETIEALQAQGIEPALIGEVPYFPGYDRECYIIQLKVSFVNCDERARAPRALIAEVNTRIGRIAETTGVAFFDFADLLCDRRTCSAKIDGAPLYYDAGHLSIDGSIRVGEMAVKDEALLAKLAAFLR
ncbi:MAG: acyltransferase family protein [Pseudomonadota bacterium]